MPRPAARNDRIEPFYVMEVVKEAARLQAAGRSVIHMSIGEPDFTAPAPVRRAAIAAIEAGHAQYTAALGLYELREAISQHYRQRFALSVAPERIVVTAGASGALLLALAALLDGQRELLMPDPCYPCNRHFATVCDGNARLVPCGPETRFQLTPALLADAWSARAAGVLLASPSNPTGTSIDVPVLRELIEAVHGRDGFVVVDEIYQGLTYDHEPSTALALSDRVIVINSFSKYFSMTGWRLGWLVVPPSLLPVVEKLAQNLFICPSTVAQYAAVACFAPESLAEYEARRAEFKRRRDFVVPALQSLGLQVPAVPDGAFYVYVDVSAFSDDSWAFAFEVLHATGVCLVPGRDFGHAAPSRYVRVSYATSLAQLKEALARLGEYLQTRRRRH
jgi:aspartate/methionine/tyrosine aminotransferase